MDPKDIDRALFNVACIVAHRIRRDDFRASCVSMFVKSKDFTVAQKQTSLAQPTDMTAVILNEARRMLGDVWDGATSLRQVGLGMSKLTHESAVQMSLFEDPKMEYYREWDRQYDEERSRAEDARMLAYEHKVTQESTKAETGPTYVVLREVTKPSPQDYRKAQIETPPPPTIEDMPRERRKEPYRRERKTSDPDVLTFHYTDGEQALAAAKKAVKSNHALTFGRKRLPDGTDCFEVTEGMKVIERHLVG